jgi:ComF family protein
VADRVPAPAGGSVLVPVPLGPARLRERGFNQSALLARELGRRWGLPVADALARVREGPDQRGAPRSARTRQAAGAFAARPGLAAPRTAVLVDDVHTTGATLAACARALRRAGVERVGAVCVARVGR